MTTNNGPEVTLHLTPAALSLLSDLLDMNDDDEELSENSGASLDTIASLRAAVEAARHTD